MTSDQFICTITVEVEKADKHGVRVYGERLSSREELTIKASTFADIAEVLGRFHQLAGIVRVDQANRLPMAPGCEACRTDLNQLTCNSGACQRCNALR